MTPASGECPRGARPGRASRTIRRDEEGSLSGGEGSRRRIAVVGPTHPFRGGAAQYTTLLVGALRRRHDVFFASYTRQYPSWLYPGGTDRDPSRDLVVAEESQHRFDAVRLRAWRELADLVGERAPELLVLPWTVTYWAPFFFVFLARLRTFPRRPRVVFLCHNVVEHEASGWRSAVTRKVLGLSDGFIAHCREDSEHLRSLLGLPDESRVRVSPHPEYGHLAGRPPDRAGARRRLGLGDEKVLLFFGFVRKYKGLEVLLESLSLILAEMPVRLVVAGEVWRDSTGCLATLARPGIAEHVTLVPRYVPNEEVADYFEASDLVVVPYLSATQSGIVQLAYGFGKPVVATRVGGLPEAVRDGETGTLVPPSDPAALARAVVDFFRLGRGEAMSAAIREARGAFSWERMVETVESFLPEAPGAGPRRAP